MRVLVTRVDGKYERVYYSIDLGFFWCQLLEYDEEVDEYDNAEDVPVSLADCFQKEYTSDGYVGVDLMIDGGGRVIEKCCI